MAGNRDRRDAWKDLALAKRAQARPVGRKLTARGLEITDPLTLGGARHLSVIVPMRHFILMHTQLRAGKADLARVADQPVRMIWVHMPQQDGVDLCRIDSGQGQILKAGNDAPEWP